MCFWSESQTQQLPELNLDPLYTLKPNLTSQTASERLYQCEDSLSGPDVLQESSWQQFETNTHSYKVWCVYTSVYLQSGVSEGPMSLTEE